MTGMVKFLSLLEGVRMDFDDKTAVIVCATALALALIFTGNEAAANITSAIVTGLFGVAVGRQSK